VLLPVSGTKFRKVYPVWRSLLPPPRSYRVRKKVGGSVQFLEGGGGGSGPVVAPVSQSSRNAEARDL